MFLIAESSRPKSLEFPPQDLRLGPRNSAGQGVGAVETLNFVLFFLLGIAGGYIWRDHISRIRHERARMEQQRERRMMDIFDPNKDGTYLPLHWPKK
jgi:hypothetical protein